MSGHAPAAVLVQACLNGGRSRREHAAIPLSPAELAADARAALAAGAAALHVHPRDRRGAETLDPDVCGAVLAEIRRVCPGAPVGLTTGAWITPDLDRRLSQISRWPARPDFASVNFSEPGAREVCEALLRLGAGIEAGLATAADAAALVESGLAPACLRVLVEASEEEPGAAVATAAAIDALLDRSGVRAPRLHHGTGAATWPVIDRALGRGHDVRVGFEDTLVLPDGRRARSNAELVAAAVRLVGQHGRRPATVPA